MERRKHRTLRCDLNEGHSDEGLSVCVPSQSVQFIEARDMTLDRFKGMLYGYIAVYKQHERSNRDIMPIHLIFE